MFARKVDAARWLAENEAARNRGAWVDPAAGRDRVGEWAERWFSSTVALRPGTRRTYRLLLDHQILPHFDAKPLASIDPLAVHEWQAGLVAAGLSPSRIATPPKCSARSSTPRSPVGGSTATRPRDSAGPASSSER